MSAGRPRHRVHRAVLWTSAALLAWVYAGYPLAAMIAGRRRPVQLRPGSVPSLVSVGIAAHDAADEIEARIENIAGQDVPFEVEVVVASDGSGDALPSIVRRLARENPRVRLLELQRIGQAAAQTAIFEAARGDVVVLTDAETRFVAGCLRALVEPFADPRVGCTTGVLRWEYDRRSDTARHEGLYWRYEQAVRRWESRAGWLTAATGALLAVRRSAFRPAPAHASLDQMLPLHAHDQGLLVLAIPEAIGIDRGSSDVADQFRSRTRIATQGIEANLRMAHRLSPWRRPGPALAIWSHKLLRWATPWLWLLAAAAATGLARGGGGRRFLAVPAGVPLAALYAAIGQISRRAGVHLPLSGFALTVVVVNTAFGLAWLRVLARRRIGQWRPASRQGEPGDSTPGAASRE
jgi:cellulose synthase/poly-beta-1,6-N-acetylglucosamine synthase-like glycosyltransferase